ncbi:uncharacterized protein LOC110179099 [Drosophila serrata]|uniref:uncharacterized protein LOC110179099 n=1 Tax=Drosophila serrata TaxID=7274 RepID=UPI000A1D03FC|nr:uncharacterized protein LOC110179099 [Drosophila serrata]
MTSHGTGSSKRDVASRVQLQLNPELQVLVNLGEEPKPVNSNSSCSSNSSSSSSSSNLEDSEGDAKVDNQPEAEAGLNLGIDCARFMYSPLVGSSESDSELDLDDVELFCEEALALLAHEIVCCDCDSDIESEKDEEVESESEMEESGSDQVEDYGQDNMSHNTYQLMFSEEDEDELLDKENLDECPYIVESVLLLEEDQESEEKSDPKSGDSLGNPKSA